MAAMWRATKNKQLPDIATITAEVASVFTEATPEDITESTRLESRVMAAVTLQETLHSQFARPSRIYYRLESISKHLGSWS